MNNFFGINVKTQKKTYEQFITRSVHPQIAAKQDDAEQRLLNAYKDSELPLWARIIQLIFFFAAICVAGGVLNAVSKALGGEEPFAQAWARFVENGVIWIIAAGCVCLAVSVALWIWGVIRKKSVAQSPAFLAVLQENEEIQKRSHEELGVPADADEINAFTYPFKLNKKGLQVNGNPFAKYVNVSLKIFGRDDCLYFADTTDLIKIPRSHITTVTAVNKRINFFGWTKEQPYNSKEFKPYKITANNIGTLFIKGYYSVGVVCGGEEIEIVIPAYEEQTLLKYITVK